MRKLFSRVIVFLLIPCLMADPALAGALSKTLLSSCPVFSSHFEFKEEALSMRLVSVKAWGQRLFSKAWLAPWRRLRKPSFPKSKEGPFKGMQPGDPPRIIDGREYSIETVGAVYLYWSKPQSFRDGDPIHFLNTGMSGLEWLRSVQIYFGKSVIDKYWIPGGYAQTLNDPNAAVAQVVGSQSDLKSIRGKTVWDVAGQRVAQPLLAIRRHYPLSGDRLHLHGLSTGAVLQACYVASGGQAESAVWINGAFQFGEGISTFMKLQRVLRWLRHGRGGGVERFLDSLKADNPKAQEFLAKLQSDFVLRGKDHFARRPRILFLSTWTEEGIEPSWAKFPEWLGMLFGGPYSDGIVNRDLARNRGPHQQPIVSWAADRMFKGTTHNAAQGDARVQLAGKLFSLGQALPASLDADQLPVAHAAQYQEEMGWQRFKRIHRSWRQKHLRQHLTSRLKHDHLFHPERLRGGVLEAVEAMVRRSDPRVSMYLYMWDFHLLVLEPLLSPLGGFILALLLSVNPMDPHANSYSALLVFAFLIPRPLLTYLVFKDSVSSLVSGIPGLGLYAGLIGLARLEPVAAPYLVKDNLRENGKHMKNFLFSKWGRLISLVAFPILFLLFERKVMEELMFIRNFMAHPFASRWIEWFKMSLLSMHLLSLTGVILWAFLPPNKRPSHVFHVMRTFLKKAA